ncbi:Prokaryotic diacylglycerol kinase [Calycomorphotria hydatis]|uniref:Prokaryotic diacylglycerol kinase n=2 Tax=Calycomorphotria hydatis TaxID=2528027 RepID=A0A517TBF7_9PLAN|nr:Prokaryotic diacylglycerol kinase [Calycomorphotria hydatis]
MWRQRLIEAERGITQGFRGDSIFFVHFFGGALILAAGIAFWLTLAEWALLVLAFSAVVTTELLHQVVRDICEELRGIRPATARRVHRLSTAAICTMTIGAIIIVCLIFGAHFCQIFFPPASL